LCTQIRIANYLYLAENYFASNNLLSAAEKEEFSKNYLNWRDNYIDVRHKISKKFTENKLFKIFICLVFFELKTD